MTLHVCLACSTAYSVGAPTCPHCGGADYAEEGTDMAKITERGPSDKTTYLVGEHGPEVVDLPPEAMVHEAPAAEVEEPAEESVDEPEEVDEEVPAGTVDDVVTWTEADPQPPARLHRALAAELERAAPRVTLTAELERRLALY